MNELSTVFWSKEIRLRRPRPLSSRKVRRRRGLRFVGFVAFVPWAMHHCALCIFTKSGALSNQANHRCIAHAGYFDKLQDNKHLRENPTNLREKPYCLLPQLTVSIFLNLLIPKNNPDFFENNQATACTEYLANTPPMTKVQ